MLLELTGLEVLAVLSSMGVIIMLSIRFYQIVISRQKNIEDTSEGISLSNRTKYPSKNILRHRGRRLGMGLVSSLVFALISMSWTVYERAVDPRGYLMTNEIEEIEVVPRTIHRTPPPPPMKYVEVVTEDNIAEPTDALPDEISKEIDVVIFVPPAVSVISKPTPPPPPLPIIEEEVPDLPFNIVEQMPLFSGCSDRICSDKALMEYIYKQIKYPAMAKESNVEGRVTAEFVIERNGQVSGIKILKGIGAGCNEEVLKVLRKMNQGDTSMWTPGKQRGKAVRVLYRMPVTFRLNY